MNMAYMLITSFFVVQQKICCHRIFYRIMMVY